MGSSQSSTHTVTIENDDLSSIKVSEAVVNRLNKTIKSTDGRKPENKAEHTPVSHNVPSVVPSGGGTQYISSLDIQRHVHNAIDENNKYWEAQVKAVNVSNDKVTALMNREYEKTLKEVEVILPPVSSEKKKNTCVDVKEKVLQCYKSNPRQSLKCLEEVNKFTSCILDSKA